MTALSTRRLPELPDIDLVAITTDVIPAGTSNNPHTLVTLTFTEPTIAEEKGIGPNILLELHTSFSGVIVMSKGRAAQFVPLNIYAVDTFESNPCYTTQERTSITLKRKVSAEDAWMLRFRVCTRHKD